MVGPDPTLQRGEEEGIWEGSPWDLACREVVGLEGSGGRACRRQGEGTRRGKHWVRKRRRRLFLEMSSGALVSIVRNEAERQFRDTERGVSGRG